MEAEGRGEGVTQALHSVAFTFRRSFLLLADYSGRTSFSLSMPWYFRCFFCTPSIFLHTNGFTLVAGELIGRRRLLRRRPAPRARPASSLDDVLAPSRRRPTSILESAHFTFLRQSLVHQPKQRKGLSSNASLPSNASSLSPLLWTRWSGRPFFEWARRAGVADDEALGGLQTLWWAGLCAPRPDPRPMLRARDRSPLE